MHADEIIGFPEAGAEAPHFDLVVGLQQAREAEIFRILDIAGRIAQQFGPAIAVGFLFYEIVGQLPDDAALTRTAERLRQSPSSAAAIVEELHALRDSRTDLIEKKC